MRTLALTIALAAAPALATAQAAQHQHGAGHAAHQAQQAAPKAEGMKTKCPLHLTTLNLTPAQDSAFKAIRAEHMAAMKASHQQAMPVMKHEAGMKHDSATHAQHMAAITPETKAKQQAAMQASMAKAVQSARAVLTAEQQATFDAAVAAHKAEKEEMKKAGKEHQCGECCDHAKMGEHGKAAAAHKHD